MLFHFPSGDFICGHVNYCKIITVATVVRRNELIKNLVISFQNTLYIHTQARARVETVNKRS